MRILYVADGRSPTALNWMQYFVEAGHEVHLASTFWCLPKLDLASTWHTPVAFSSAVGGGKSESRGIRDVLPVSLRTRIRQWFGPFTLGSAARRLREVAKVVQPDLVHAMRIPFEGMLAAEASLQAPLLVSVWGNDFTLHAPASPWMGRATRRTTRRSAALHTDTERDHKLAEHWGFDPKKASIILPGNGGVRSEFFYPRADEEAAGFQVINPRGLRAYVRNDTFFKAVPLVLRDFPETRFLCPAMAGEPEAEKWVRELRLEGNVRLMPKLSPNELAESYRGSQVMVSPSTHDGTPNTLLEAMACGCFPVLGDIESVREWVRDGENGLLVDPGDPQALAKAILRAFQDTNLRTQAAQINSRLVAERANYANVMAHAEAFYARIIKG